MNAGEVVGLVVIVTCAIGILASITYATWPSSWNPEVRRHRREQAEAEAAQEREEAQARLEERRKWWPWVQMSAWDDAYQSISEQAGIKCDDCSQRNGYRGGIIVHYSPTCPLHEHRWRTRSPAYNHSPRYHLEDVQPVLDRLDITPPRYTNEGTLK